MTTTKTTGAGIAYDGVGTGTRALLCLPGWCGPRTVFDPLVPVLAEEHRVLSLDWRGHGESAPAAADFGLEELVDDARSVLDQSGVANVVPVALSHAGWAAIELRRRLGAERVPKIVLLDWMVLGAPPPFRDALDGMRAPYSTRHVVDEVLGMWSAGLDLPALDSYLKEMASTPDEMWQRAAREIAASFDADPSPLQAIAALDPAPLTLHLYAQPADPAVLEAQQAFSTAHPWFEVERLPAESHFPMFEVPDAMAKAITDFVR